MIRKKKLPDDFFDHTFISELKMVRTLKKEHRKNKKYLEYLSDYERDIQKYCVGILERVKDGDNNAFDELLKLKDIRNFIYYHSYHVHDFFKYKFDEEDIVHEVRYQLFYHLYHNYRIYNEPHEIVLFVNSMRSWMRFKAGKIMLDVNKPKNDEYLQEAFLESHIPEDELIIEDLIERYLTGDERKVFELRHLEDLKYVDIGEELGFSKDTAQRKYLKALDIIKKKLEKYGGL